jgi:hypothetical protein
MDQRMLLKWMVALCRVRLCSGVVEDQLSKYELLDANPSSSLPLQPFKFGVGLLHDKFLFYAVQSSLCLSFNIRISQA